MNLPNAPYDPLRFVSARVFFVLVLVSAQFSACTCEDKVRNLVNERAERQVSIDAGKKVSSQPTEVEPNDGPEKASPILLKKELRATLGDVNDAADVDWFELAGEGEVDEFVELQVKPDLALDVSVHLEMPGVEGMPLGYNLAGAGESESVPVYRIAADRPVRFAVKGEGGTTGKYEITFVRLISAGAVEAEPNDHPSVAHALQLPAEVQGVFDRPDDRDVIALTVPEAPGEKDSPAVFAFEFVPVANVAQVVRFYDAPELSEPVLSLQMTGARDARGRIPNLTIPAGSDTLWMVLTTVEGFDRSSSYLARFTTIPDVADGIELEPNDRKPQPVGMPAKIRGFLHSPEDVDHFILGVTEEPTSADAGAAAAGADMGPDEPSANEALQVQPSFDAGEVDAPDMGQGDAGATDAGGADAGFREELESPWTALPEKSPSTRSTLRVELEPAREGVEVGLKWTDSTGETDVLPAGAGRKVVICGRTFVPGEAEITVRPIKLESVVGSRPAVDYILTVSEEVGGTGFEVEPNNSTREADRLETSGRGHLREVSDVDVWGFVAEPQGGAPSVGLQLKLAAHPLQKVSARVLDEEGLLVAEFPDGVGERTMPLDLPRGLYFVELRATESGGCEPYTLDVLR